MSEPTDEQWEAWARSRAGTAPAKALLRLLDAERAKVSAVRKRVDAWEAEAGPNSAAWAAYGPQMLSVPFVVKELRSDITDQPTNPTT